MAEVTERTKPTSISLTPSELEAIRFVQTLHGAKYDGITNVLRDYSIGACVQVHQRALEATAA